MLIPKKSLGQNFLLDNNILEKISNITKIKNKNVLEIGPGTGQLTNKLISKKPNILHLIEKDVELFNSLNKKYKNNDIIKIYNDDALNFNYTNYKDLIVFSNLPFNIASKLIIFFLKKNFFFSEFIFIIQKEVADKIDINKNKKMNKLKFFINILANYSIKFQISKKLFYPKPKVNSTVVSIKPKNNNLIDKNKLYSFSNLIFQHKRKKLSNILRYKNLNNKINNLLDNRAEDLNLEDLFLLFNEI